MTDEQEEVTQASDAAPVAQEEVEGTPSVLEEIRDELAEGLSPLLDTINHLTVEEQVRILRATPRVPSPPSAPEASKPLPPPAATRPAEPVPEPPRVLTVLETNGVGWRDLLRSGAVYNQEVDIQWQ